MTFDPYRILGIAPGASAQEIRRAYLELARRSHPDVCREPSAEDRFKQLNLAYSLLKEETARQARRASGGTALGGEAAANEAPRGKAQPATAPGDLLLTLEVSQALATAGGSLQLASPVGGGLLRVQLPAGVLSGERIRIPGRGRAGGRGRRPGDLYLQIVVKPSQPG